jgi:hypothetical protein
MTPVSAFRRGLARARKRRYDAYIDSRAWRARREAWAAEEERRTGSPIRCAVCGYEWLLGHDDMHHLEYARLGTERHDDLVPLHRQAHDEVHHLLDRLGLRRRMPLRLANLHVLGTLHRDAPCSQATARHPVSDE